MKQNTLLFSKDYLAKSRNQTVHQNYACLLSHLKSTIDAVPSKVSSTRFNLPWLSAKTKRMCRKKRRVYAKAKAGSEKHKAMFTELQNATRDALRKDHWSYINGILEQSQETGDTKKFWRYVKAQKQDSAGVAPLRSGGELMSDATGKARVLGDQFASVFTEDTPETADLRSEGPAYPPIHDLTIQDDGIEKLLSGLNASKASGPDEIPARLLKELSQELAPVVASLFRQSIETGDVPDEWTSAWITPVFKKGARSDPANYRPVSLTCILCKLLEHVLCTHIRGHLDSHGILCPENHGFRSKHSCETQLLLTTHDLMSQRDQGYQIDVAILDFSKAFDTVPHRRLLGKLDLYGINGNVHRWISNFLVGRKQSVIVDGIRSDDKDVKSGVPQGTVLGPLLFLLHINDIVSAVDPSTKCRLFADDCLLYRTVKTPEDQPQLQRDLTSMEKWADNWGMRFNASKCHIMTIGKGQKHDRMYSLCNSILKGVSQEKYLGVLISDNLSWAPHIQNVATAAS